MTVAWHRAAIVWLLICVALIAAFWSSWREILQLWTKSENYTHGPLVPLISGWLMWRLFRTIREQHAPKFSKAGAIALVLIALAWAIADLIQISAVRHFAVMLSLIAAFAMVFGMEIFRANLFPLLFLLFAVPFGDFLTEPMMEQTADFTVAALQWTGIPVFREARLLQVPTGNWSVVEACSGTRYLFASVMLGALFAYLFYRSTKRRVLFVLASIIVPVVGNWVRAYLIVLIGHLTHNKYGVGADHILFGWVFFGALIYIMFAIGARWREDDDAPAAGVAQTPAPAFVAKQSLASPFLATALACTVPFLTTLTQSTPAAAATLPALKLSGWSSEAANPDGWKPQISGARVSEFLRIRSAEEGAIVLYRGVFAGQRDEHRMIRFGNSHLSQAAVGEAFVKNSEIDLLAPMRGKAAEYTHREPQGVRVIRGVYVVGETSFASPYFAKLALAKAQLTGQGDRSMMVVWSAVGPDEAIARARLVAFERAAGAALLAQN